MAHQQDFGTPTPSPLGSKAQRQAIRIKARQPLLLRSPDKKKYRIAWPRNQWCWLYEEGKWTRHYNLFSDETWDPVANDLEMLVMTGISRREIAEKAAQLRRLKQNRDHTSLGRWNCGKRNCGKN